MPSRPWWWREVRAVGRRWWLRLDVLARVRSGLDSAFGSRLIATALSLQALTNAWITAGTSLEAIAESSEGVVDEQLRVLITVMLAQRSASRRC
ncbi:hypothetical protein ABZ468_50295 [Streptomyces sp. NPDC005708]|uniref:hypothetical protein n=1 Tax=Streptomyces sp. NPDC005708 TaxID=3154564 RepID=UPI0033EEA7E3